MPKYLTYPFVNPWRILGVVRRYNDAHLRLREPSPEWVCKLLVNYFYPLLPGDERHWFSSWRLSTSCAGCWNLQAVPNLLQRRQLAERRRWLRYLLQVRHCERIMGFEKFDLVGLFVLLCAWAILANYKTILTKTKLLMWPINNHP